MEFATTNVGDARTPNSFEDRNQTRGRHERVRRSPGIPVLLVAVLPGFAVGGARHYPYVANSDFHQPKHLYSWKTLLRCEKHWPANQAGPAGLHERAGYPPAAVLLQAPEPSRLGESETQRLISKNWASTRVAVTADEPATPE